MSCATRTGGESSSAVDLGLTNANSQTYQARWLPAAKIELDGRAHEAAWAQAAVERRFAFPWKQAPAPATQFRALWDDANFYFTFRVADADIVALERLTDSGDVVLEDRVEMILSRDERMKDYFGFEMDSRGRVYDYRASFYRKFDPAWDFAALETKASPLPDGYEVEGRIPLASISALGFPALRPGVRIRFGLYRAEFSHDRRPEAVKAAPPKKTIHNLGRKSDGSPPIEDWISWVNPGTREPDFHVPASLGWLEFVR